MLKSYRDLLVWQKAMELTLEIYQFSSSFPRLKCTDLLRSFAGQAFLCRLILPKAMEEEAVRKEYVQFLCISQGSLKELETRVILAQRLSYGSKTAGDDLLTLSEEVGRMLGALIHSLRMKMA